MKKCVIIACLLLLLFSTSCSSKNQHIIGFTCSNTQISDFDLSAVRNDNFAEKVNQGVGRNRIGGNWEYVDYDGNILPYDFMGGYYEDIPICVVELSGKYGMINADFDLIIPIEYDVILRAHKLYPNNRKEYSKSIFYAFKDSNWVTIDIEKKTIISFSKEREMCEDIYLFSDFDAVISDGEILSIAYNGENIISENTESYLPSFINQPFSIFVGSTLKGTDKLVLEQGEYLDEIFGSFPRLTGTEYDIGFFGEVHSVNATTSQNLAMHEKLSMKMYEHYSRQMGTAISIESIEAFDINNSLLLNFYIIDNQKKPLHIVSFVSNSDNLENYKEIFRGECVDESIKKDNIRFIGVKKDSSYFVLFNNTDKAGSHVEYVEIR